MATIREVAQAAGVSIATVSRVCSGSPHVRAETRRRVHEAADRLDFCPNSAARSLITNRTNALGVLLPDLYGEFFSEVIRGIDRAARAARLQILLSSSHADIEELLWAANSMHGRIDGLIAMTPDARLVEAIRQATRRVRVLLLNPWSDLPGCDSVAIANYDGAQALVRHLLRCGHREIAAIRGPKGNIDAEERLRGYRNALEEAAIKPSPRLVLEGDFTEAAGYLSAERLVKLRPRPTAVFAGNDSMAIGLMSGLRRRGLQVPDDMAVVGFDDIAIAQYLSPALTTVRVPACALGERAVQRWCAGASGPARDAQHEVLPTSLILRASCGGNGHAARTCGRGARRQPARYEGSAFDRSPAGSGRSPRKQTAPGNGGGLTSS